MGTPDEKWFRERLYQFLQERHPTKQQNVRFIEQRSRMAAEHYLEHIANGETTKQATLAADKVLFRGLLFSKYDTIYLTLSTDFPAIPENQRRNVALKLLRICSPIFAVYNLGDDFSERPEFRQLKDELRIGIRNFIDENGVPGYRSPARHEPTPTPYSKRPKYSKRK